MLTSECGHNEYYGDTDGGAAFCYILKLGDASSLLRLMKILRHEEKARTLSLGALFWEYELSFEMMVHVFIHGTGQQRSELLEEIDIRVSEGMNMVDLLEALAEVDLTAKERKMINATYSCRKALCLV